MIVVMLLSIMNSKEIIWVVFALLVIILDIAVPYTVLKDVSKFSGPYLYWAVLTLVVIVAGWIYISRWKTDVTLGDE